MLALANIGMLAAPALAGTLGAQANLRGTGVAAEIPDLRKLRDLGRAPMQGDAASPLYHHFLSNAQFANYFAPSSADEHRVALSLEHAGFRITGLFANRTVVDAVAPAAVAERYFATEIHRVVQPEYGIRYVNVRPAIVPEEWRGTVIAVTGLANTVYARTAQQMADAQENHGQNNALSRLDTRRRRSPERA